MGIRRTKRKRLLIVAGVAVAIVALGAGAYVFRQSQLSSEARAARETGLAALERGDFKAALHGIGRYIGRFEEEATAEDWAAYARASRHVEQSGYGHMQNSVNALKRALALAPDERTYRSELLDVYLQLGWATESLETTERLLEQTPDDVELLRTKAELLAAVGRYEDALEVAQRVNDLRPEDVEASIFTLALFGQLKTPAPEVEAWVDSVRGRLGDPSRVLLLEAAAATARGDQAAASERLDQAIASPAPDARHALVLVRLLDRARRHQDAVAVLETVPSEVRTPALEAELLRRLWYEGRYEDVVEHARSAKDQAERDTASIALEAMALSALGRGAEARPLLERLEDRPLEAEARAWAIWLGPVLDGRSARLAPSEVGETARLALTADSTNAFVRQALGDAYAALGETELALAAWRRVASDAEAWALPHARIASTLAGTGRFEVAVSEAREALLRAPTSADALSLLVDLCVHGSGDLDPETREKVADIVAKVQERSPLEPRTVAAHVALLARSDAARAEEVVRAALAKDPALPAPTLLDLAAVCERTGIPLSAECLSLCEQVHGSTPELALSSATLTAGAEGIEAGLEVLRSKAEAAGSDDPQWDVARARLLERLDDPRAPEEWASVAAAHADDPAVQVTVLGSDAARRSRKAYAAVIERVREAVGESGVGWRIARARLLLEDPDAEGTQNFSEAATLLGEVVSSVPQSGEARVLLAQAMARLGNPEGAVQQLAAAAQANPRDSGVLLNLAVATARAGRPEEALAHLENAQRAGFRDARQVAVAAELFLDLGHPGRAVELLRRTSTGREPTRRETVLLAQSLVRTGDTEGALALSDRLLERPDVEAVTLMAGLYAARGRRDAAEATIERLDATDAPQWRRDLVRARFRSLVGDDREATRGFLAAAAAAPEEPSVWQGFLEHAIRRGDADSVARALDGAKAAANRDPGLARAVRRRDAVLVAAQDPILRFVALDLLRSERPEEALLEAVETARAAEADPLAAADRAGALAERHPRTLSLHLLAAHLRAEAGQPGAAAVVAARAMSLFPEQVEPAEFAARAYARAGSWPEALSAARAWRARSITLSPDADVLLGEALIRTGRPADGLNVLRPLIPAALEDPDLHGRVILVQALGLLVSGRRAEAERFLLPLARGSADWRRHWIGLGFGLHGTVPEAEAWLGTVEELTPEDEFDTRSELARSYHLLGRATGSKTASERARRLLAEAAERPGAGAEVHFLLGAAAEEAGDQDVARASYRRALEVDPEYGPALNNLAMLLAAEGRSQEAVELARRAVASAPNDPEYLDTLALVYAAGGNLDEAVEPRRRTVELDPDNPQWSFRLAETLLAAGRTEESREIVARLRDPTVPRSGMSKDLRDQIDQLAERLGSQIAETRDGSRE